MGSWCCSHLLAFYYCIMLVPTTICQATNLIEERVEFTVQEGAPPNYVIGSIQKKPGYTYYVNEKNHWFTFDAETGNIVVAVELDRERMPSDVVELVILGRRPTYFTTVQITVLDINDQAPTFLYPFFNISIPESASVGTTKVLPGAKDDDKAQNGRIVSYSMTGADNEFRLGRPADDDAADSPLILELIRPLDRERTPLYVLNITATDGGTPPLTGQLTVFINVQDTNDNAPQFSNDHYNVSVPESITEGTRLLSVNATDADSGPNAQIMYRLSDDNQFAIDSITGDITTKVPKLDCPMPTHCREVAPDPNLFCRRTCIFTAEAIDHGLPPQTGRAFINVMIVDENDHRPVVSFRPFPDGDVNFASLAEDAKVGSPVSLVTVTDDDVGKNGIANVRISAGNEQGFFELKRDVFFTLIKLKRPLHSVATRSFTLTVTAVDGGVPPKTGSNTLVVYIRDIDDKPPTFSRALYTASVAADSVPGSYVTEISTVYSTKHSETPKTFYQFLKGNEDGYFNLSSKTGLITVAQSLAVVSQRTFEIDVSAKKDGPSIETATAKIRITVEPGTVHVSQFTQALYSVVIPEDTPVGSLVAEPKSVDFDSGISGALVYGFHTGSNATYYQNFVIEAKTGALYLQRALDREVVDYYRFEVKVSDARTTAKSATTILQIHVADVNDNAPFFKTTEYHRNLLTTDQIGSVILRVEAFDADLGDTLSYFLQSGQTESFNLDSKTGLLTIKRLPITAASPSSVISLTISAQDAAGHVATNSVQVSLYLLTDANDTPTFVRPKFNFSILEDSAGFTKIGKAIGTTSATDYDFDNADQIQYRITDGNQDHLFDIGQYSGELRSKAPIDRELFAHRSLTVVAVSQRGVAESHVNVTILDVNDNPPTFTSGDIRNGFAEILLHTDTILGATIFNAAAVDPDSGENGKIVYRILPENSPFAINKEGMVLLNTPVFLLTERNYTLHIRATDGGTPPLTSELTLAVAVEASPPKDIKTYYSFTVSEDTPVNSMIAQLNLTLPEHNQFTASVLYSDITAAVDAPFSVFPNGWIYVKNELDYEKQSGYRMTVNAVYGPYSVTVLVEFLITDTNDNGPVCDEKLFRFGFKENAPLFSFVGFVGVSDADSGLNGAVFYELLDHTDKFHLDSTTGAISSLTQFDKEISPPNTEFNLKFRAHDFGEPRRSVDCHVHIKIEDENDNRPVFPIDVFSAVVSENADIGNEVLKVTAVDGDTGENANISYRFQTENDKFSLNETSGLIRLSKHLDRETADHHKLLVQAVDNGTPALNSTALVVITVSDINDNAPIFVKYPQQGLNLSETTAIGSRVARFSAIDSDLELASKVVYSIATGNTERTFEIDSVFGDLILVKPLDYEQTSAYTLTIRASDMGMPPLATTVPVVINVFDENDNPPKIETNVLKVDENLPAGSPVGKIVVSDADSGMTTELRCSIADQQPSKAFSIDEQSGQVFMIDSLNREVIDTYSLHVICTDSASDVRHTIEKTVTVIVVDRNDNAPRFVGPLAATVDVSSATTGHQIARLKISDADAGLNGNTGLYLNRQSDVDDLFDLRFSGELLLKGSLADYPRSKFEITVMAKDRINDRGDFVADEHNPAKSTSVQYTVIPLPFNPGRLKFDQDSYKFDVSEDAALGFVVGRVLASGAASLEYYVTECVSAASGDALDHYITVGLTSGQLTVQMPLDRETIGDILKLRVASLDATAVRPSAVVTTVLITIRDVNDEAPKLGAAQLTFDVVEDASVGTEVGRIRASDADSYGKLQFSLKPSQNAYFAIDEASGLLSTTSLLDRETAAEHHLFVVVSDGVHSTAARVIVNAQDVNDTPPTFKKSLYQFEVSEKAARNSFVGQVTAIDADAKANGVIRYRLKEKSTVEKLFHIDKVTGIITVSGFLDAETQSGILFDIIADDMGTPPLSSVATVFVMVKDINDNKPYFEQQTYSAFIAEDVPVGTVVTSEIVCHDKDTDTNLVFKITQGDPHGNFWISKNGTVTVAQSLDRERREKFQLTISAFDSSSTSSYSHVTNTALEITVEDVNDNHPMFTSPREAHVSEDAPVGTIVTILKASDADLGRNGAIEFHLDPRSAGVFSVDPVLGYVRVNQLLDRERRSRYNLTVYARDKGSPRLTTESYLVVHVDDVDDNLPTFIQHSASVSVAEDAPISSTVFRFDVRDHDVGSNAAVIYSIIDGDERQDFHLEVTTGALTVARSLESRRTSTYNLTVVAKHANIEPSAKEDAVTTLLIRVEDRNNHRPIFPIDPIQIQVFENLLGPYPAVIGKAAAVDHDSGLNSKLSYSIIQGNTTVFSVDSMNGLISQHVPLDREVKEVYELIIEVTDSGVPRLSSSGRVVVTVLDQNDNSPVFDRPIYDASVEENRPIGTFVTAVSATDDDTGEAGRITFTFASNTAAPFMINHWSGVIQTAAVLDREHQSNYALTVIASDNDPNVLRSTSATVNIHVIDQNDNKPVIRNQHRDAYVKDSLRTGDFVYAVDAFDADDGNSTKLSFALSGDAADSFTVDSNGIIRTTINLDGSRRQYAVLVTVSSAGNSSTDTNQDATARLNFYPKSASEFPAFKAAGVSQKYTISEKAKETTVATILARSPKPAPADRISYAIVSGNTGDAFRIHSQLGLLSTTPQLDRELADKYDLWISATDAATPPLSSFLTIHIDVEDENDNRPVFSQTVYRASLSENELPLTTVLHVTAMDADLNENAALLYELDNASSVHAAFKIDSKTGVIKTIKSLDRETQEFYRFSVIATDTGSPPLAGIAVVEIQVLDENDNAPKFTRLFRAQVSENAQIGSFVTQITASDPDSNSNSNNTFYLSENPGAKFAINPQSGNVTVNGPLDREMVDSYSLKVMAVDGSWRIDTSLTIEVLDVNDNAPLFSQTVYKFNISELQPILSKVGTVAATDADGEEEFSEISYLLAERSTSFKLDAKSGALLTLKPFYFNKNGTNKHTLEVIAEDGGSPRLEGRAKIEVMVTERNNHSPLCLVPDETIAISAKLPPNTPIFQLRASDQDTGENGRIGYHLQKSANTSSNFHVNIESGWITNKRTIGPVDTEYRLTIFVEDFGTPSRFTKCLLTVVVVGENKHNPEFPKGLYQLIVAENTPIGTVIDKLDGRDRDEGLNGEIRYSIQSTASFAINAKSGMISVVKSLDYETKRVHNFSVIATDLGAPPRSSSVKISVAVIDQNDNPPRFNSTHMEIAVFENENTVGRVTATDLDATPHNNIRYSLLSDPDSLFDVNHSNGEITVRHGKQLDFERKKHHKLTIGAQDMDKPKMIDKVQIDVAVRSRNEFKPKFSQKSFNFTAYKMSPVNSVIGSVVATDLDEGGDGVVYYFIATLAAREWFSIDFTSGTLSTAASLSNLPPVLTFAVMAKNKNSTSLAEMDSCNVTVSLSDGTPPPPAFTQQVFEVEVVENSPRGTSVVQVGSTGGNYDYFYSIIGGNEEHSFGISADSGVVQVIGFVDREHKDAYRLQLGAQRKGENGLPQSGSFDYTSTVRVKVKDVNDNPPRIPFANCIGHITEGDPAYTNIMQLAPQDADASPNQGPFSFRILNSDLADKFEIDDATGVIRSKVVLDREERAVYRLRVQVSDAGKPRMTTEELITIRIDDVNDSPPTADPVTITALVDGNSLTMPTNLGYGYPADFDLVGNFKCSVIDGGEEGVSVGGDCAISVEKLTATKRHIFTIEGSDGLHEPTNYTLTINIVGLTQRHLDAAVNVTLDSVSEEDVLKLIAVLPDSALLINKQVVDDQRTNILVTVPGHDGAATERLIGQLQLPTVTEVVFNRCQSNPCKNNGRCRVLTHIVDGPWQFTRHFAVGFAFPNVQRRTECICSTTFGGERCETMVNLCQSSPCQNGGTCSLQADGVICRCLSGYMGKHCETDINECASSPCANGGHCENTPGSYKCICLIGYGGDHCTRRVNHCRSDPCLNGGRCYSDRKGYRCVCRPGFGGNNCGSRSHSFDGDTFVELPSLHHHRNYVSLEFSTLEANGLLLYSYNSAGGTSDYIGVDIVDGRLRLSAQLAGQGNMNLMLAMSINDGSWYQLQIDHKFRSVTISVARCSEYGLDCDVCAPSNRTCSLTADHGLPHVLVPGDSIFLGGVRNFSDLITRPGQVSSFSFVGCIRAFQMNDRTLDTIGVKSQYPPTLNTCKRKMADESVCSLRQDVCESGRCGQTWRGFQCDCADTVSSTSYKTNGVGCNSAIEPRSFNGGYIQYRPLPSHQKQMLFTPIDAATVVNSDDLFPLQHAIRGSLLNKRTMRSVFSRAKPPVRLLTAEPAAVIDRSDNLPTLAFSSADTSVKPSSLTAADLPPSMIEIDFRTLSQDGLIFFAALSKSDFYILDISNGTLRYLAETSNPNLRPVKAKLPYYVADGEWHRVHLSLSTDGKVVEWGLDGSKTKLVFKNDAYHEWFLRPGLQFVTIGGLRDTVVHDGYSHMIEVYGVPVPEFTGCIRRFVVNSELQPLSSSSGVSRFFDIVNVGVTSEGCFGPMGCRNPPCSAEQMNNTQRLVLHILIAVVIFVVIMAVAILVAWLFRKRWRFTKNNQGLSPSALLGNLKLISAPLASGARRSGDVGGAKTDSSSSLSNSQLMWLRNDLHQSRLSMGTTHRADSIVGLDAAVFQIGSTNAYQNNISMGSLNEPSGSGKVSTNPVGSSSQPVRYDLDNASSIAPSDIDVTYHYKGYHDGSAHRKKSGARGKQTGGNQTPQSPLTQLASMTNGAYRSSPASVKELKAALRASPASAAFTGGAAVFTTSSSEDQRPGPPVRPPIPAPRRSRSSKRRKKSDSPASAVGSREQRKLTSDSSDSNDAKRPPPPPAHHQPRTSSLHRRAKAQQHRHPPPVDDSSTENHSEIESVDCTVEDTPHRLDLDRVRKPRQLLAYPSETDTDFSDVGASGPVAQRSAVPTSLAPFRPPRSMFPGSEDDSDATTTADLPNTFRPIGQPPALPPRPSRRERDAQPSPPSWYHQVEDTPAFGTFGDDDALRGSFKAKTTDQNLEAFV